MADSNDRFRIGPKDLDLLIDPASLPFRTTEEIEPLGEVIGQERALRSLDFGIALRQRGYNVYVSGVQGTGKLELLAGLLATRARQEPTPDDWVYVNNFDAPDQPLALRLRPGNGVRLRNTLDEVISRLRSDLPKALKAEDFAAERERLGTAYGKRSEALFNELVERGRQLNLAVRRLPTGAIVFIPLKDGRPLEPEQIDQLSDDERADIERRQAELGEFASQLMEKQQEISRELRNEVEEIVRGLARRIIDPPLERAKSENPGRDVAAWLDRLRQDMLEHLERFRERDDQAAAVPPLLRGMLERQDELREYRVNVVSDNSRTEGAPVVVEWEPTYKNLFGTIEREVHFTGQVTTDFTRIKEGSLLRANGGYLLLEFDDAVTEPLVWKELKRTLKSGELHPEAYEPLALFTTAGLRPQPIPIHTKVVAVGSSLLYYLLHFYDPDFRELFKVRADFDSETDRRPETEMAYARFVAKLVRSEGLLPFDAAGVAELIRFGMREVAHREKLSAQLAAMADLVREASHWAHSAGAAVVGADHVRRAIGERVFRSDRLAAKIRELIHEGTLRLSIEGARVGQVNGLAVLDLGDFRFGKPSRVTASIGVGQEGLVNIERESKLSGSIHDKGVLILEGYLRNRYARQRPIALSASLAFEQSYGWVEGDSASSVELYCLLSAIAGVPLRQDVAVTGSVNQHGEVQAVGGVIEKIEGFFDVCRRNGLSGTQGVCIPRSNVRHLVLRPDVVEAVAQRKFHIWAIDTIDEGIELLTGMPAGDAEQEGTFHHRASRRLQEMLASLREAPLPGAAARVSVAPRAEPSPAPPPLPGEGP